MLQSDLEQWMKRKFEDQWHELEKIGFSTQRMGNRVVKINRTLEP